MQKFIQKKADCGSLVPGSAWEAKNMFFAIRLSSESLQNRFTHVAEGHLSRL